MYIAHCVNALANVYIILQKFPLQLTWRRGPDMPFETYFYIQSVVVQGKVYVGGGNAYSDEHYIVMEYDPHSHKWGTLPPYRARNFAMTVISDQLVLVGGRGRDGKASKAVSMWKADHMEWTHPYPEMPTARSQCSAVANNEWLVVAGGKMAEQYLSSVKVLNTKTKEWHTRPPLPVPLCNMKTATVGDTFYFMGGYDNGRYTDKVYSTSIQALTLNVSSERERVIWKEISGLQLYFSAPLSISGSLFAVGGMGKDHKLVTAIHLYQPNTGEWVKVGDLPSSRHECTCVMNICSSELLVLGGMEHNSRLDVASLH